MTPDYPAQLHRAREGLLGLHQALLRAEQEAWERMNGRQLGKVELLTMTISDPWFAWLQPLTATLVAMDEIDLEDREEVALRVPAFLQTLRDLLHPDDDGDDFQQRYFEFIQRSPDVTVAHGQAMRALHDPSEPDGPDTVSGS